jgi:purine nucleoside phosphorylase
MQKALVGVMGGSGLYQMDELQNAQEHQLDTPFGKPSDVVVTGEVDGVAWPFWRAMAVAIGSSLLKCHTGPISMHSSNSVCAT